MRRLVRQEVLKNKCTNVSCLICTHYFDNVITKFIVNNRTEAWKTDVHLFFAITNCQIVRSRTLPHRINYKFMCLSAYWRSKLANERARICAVIVKTCFVSWKLSFLYWELLSLCCLLRPFWNFKKNKYIYFSHNKKNMKCPRICRSSWWTVMKDQDWRQRRLENRRHHQNNRLIVYKYIYSRTSGLPLRPPLPRANSFPKYQKFFGQITTLGISFKRPPLVGDGDQF